MFKRKTERVEIPAKIFDVDNPEDEGDEVVFVFRRPTADEEAEYEDNRLEFKFDRTEKSGNTAKTRTFKMSLYFFDKLLKDVKGASYEGPDGEPVEFNLTDKPLDEDARKYLGINTTPDLFPNNVKHTLMTQLFNPGNIDIEAVKKK